MGIIGIRGAYANHSGAAAIDLLVGVTPRWGTVAGCLDIERYRVSVLLLARVACCHGCHHTCLQHGLADMTIRCVWACVRISKGTAQDVGAVCQGKFDAFEELFIAAITSLVHDFDGHDFGTWGDARLGAGIPLSGHDTGAMASVSVVVHGVVVVVDDIIAVVGVLGTAIPHAFLKIDMVVVHACVEDGHDDPVAGIACAFIVPYRRGVHLVHMPTRVLRSDFSGRFIVWNPLAKHVVIHVSDLVACLKLTDGLVGRLAGETVENPEGFHG